MLSAKSQAVVLERDRGDTLAAIAERHEISHQRVSAILRSATEWVSKIELDLMLARRTGDACIYVIPYSPNYTLAVAIGDWLTHRLRARDLEISVKTRPWANGTGLEIADLTDYSGGDQ
jgi:hypothetical protein